MVIAQLVFACSMADAVEDEPQLNDGDNGAYDDGQSQEDAEQEDVEQVDDTSRKRQRELFGDDEEAEQDDEQQEAAMYHGHEEAIEENTDIKEMLKSKRRKPQEDPEAVRIKVDTFCKQMEVAAEMDMNDHNTGKIAMAKLRMIQQVDDFCSNNNYRQQLIESKVTSGMKAWLCPYHDGTLPHVKVRTAVLRNLAKLDLDTSDEEVKSMLKETQIGHYVMFLAKNQDESPENRKLAMQITQKWAKPLWIHDAAARREKDAERAQLYRERKQKEKSTASPAEAARKALQPGDPGYRQHATIPKASKLDYVTAPESTAREKQGTSTKNDALTKKMREVTKKMKGGAARAMKPSVEGRGMLL